MSLVYLPAAMYRIEFTGKRLLQQELAVWQH
jgi:hypothetical protein